MMCDHVLKAKAAAAAKVNPIAPMLTNIWEKKYNKGVFKSNVDT